MKKTTMLICAAILLSGCGKTDLEQQLEDDNVALRGRIGELEGQLAEIKDRSDTMSSASDELVSEVARFDEDEDWKEVVPSVQSASGELESAQAELSEAIENWPI